MKTAVWPLIIAFNKSSAQIRGRLPIIFSDTNYNLAVNKNNQPAVATKGSEMAFARSVNGVWRKAIVDENYFALIRRKKTWRIQKRVLNLRINNAK